jgi:UDP-2-acetamido-3-amino-2,3-dideoxy-glucuronate N-acetyltransferase
MHGVPEISPAAIRGATLSRLPSAADARGELVFGEAGRHIPFEVRRFFLVHGVPEGTTRGEHAHRRLHQFLICIEGSCSVLADDGRAQQEFLLDDPTLGLHVEPMVWAAQRNFSSDAKLLVFASEIYDPADYIETYAEFLRAAAA